MTAERGPLRIWQTLPGDGCKDCAFEKSVPNCTKFKRANSLLCSRDYRFDKTNIIVKEITK